MIDFIVFKCVEHIGENILENVYGYYKSPKPRCRPRIRGLRQLQIRSIYLQTMNEKIGFGLCCTSDGKNKV